MRRFTIIPFLLLFAAISSNLNAQDHIYIWKDNKIVDFYSIEKIDSITFSGVPENFDQVDNLQIKLDPNLKIHFPMKY